MSDLPGARRAKPVRASRNLIWLAAAFAGVLLLAAAVAVYRARPGPGAAVTELPAIRGLVTHPANPDISQEILWIPTQRGLFRARGGTEWVRVGGETFDMTGFVAHPKAYNVLFASGRSTTGAQPWPLGMQISRNEGRTWEPVALAGEAAFVAMAISRADPQVLYAWGESVLVGLYRSRDGGRTWEAPGPRGLDRVVDLAAHPKRAVVVYAATARGLLVSEDAGDTWKPLGQALLDVPVTAIEVHPADPRIMYAYARKPSLGLVRSDDGGQQWTPAGFYAGDQDTVVGLTADPANSRIVYVATRGGDIDRSSDGGKTRERLLTRGKVGAR